MEFTAFVLAASSFQSEFYSACAQVLPIVFLAAAVEFRLLTYDESHVRQWKDPGSRTAEVYLGAVFTTAFVLTVAIGEFAALQALAERRERAATDELVIGSLVATGVAVGVAPLLQLFQAANVVTSEADAEPGTGDFAGAEGLVTMLSLLAVVAIPLYLLGRTVTSVL